MSIVYLLSHETRHPCSPDEDGTGGIIGIFFSYTECVEHAELTMQNLISHYIDFNAYECLQSKDKLKSMITEQLRWFKDIALIRKWQVGKLKPEKVWSLSIDKVIERFLKELPDTFDVGFVQDQLDLKYPCYMTNLVIEAP